MKTEKCKMQKPNKSLKNGKRAVSPVIGVILMVAITVILAAVIGAFVFGMGGTMKKTYLVGATASQTGNIISVTYSGGPDHNMVGILTYRGINSAAVEVSWDDPQPGVSADSTWAPTSGNYTLTNPGVGDTIIATTGGTAERDHIIVGASFVDGTTQLILDTYV